MLVTLIVLVLVLVLLDLDRWTEARRSRPQTQRNRVVEYRITSRRATGKGQ